jgi:hypothetical protein
MRATPNATPATANIVAIDHGQCAPPSQQALPQLGYLDVRGGIAAWTCRNSSLLLADAISSTLVAQYGDFLFPRLHDGLRCDFIIAARTGAGQAEQ